MWQKKDFSHDIISIWYTHQCLFNAMKIPTARLVVDKAWIELKHFRNLK